ncbi:MAG: cell division protein ZapA [Bacteroidales bacterium]
MDQKITLKIGVSSYQLKVSSPEQESKMRKAAEMINKTLTVYDSKFPDKSLSDKMAFVAINETFLLLNKDEELEKMKSEIQKLRNQTESYLENIEKSGR